MRAMPMAKSCAPDPRSADKTDTKGGGRKTSPWMSFHPDSRREKDNE